MNDTSPARPDITLGSVSTKPSIWTQIARDERLSHGAVHLWHLILSYGWSKGYCWPGQRELKQIMKCDSHSLKPWTAQLVDAGFLKVETYDPQKHREPEFPPSLQTGTFIYFLPIPVVEKRNARVVETHNAKAKRDAETHNGRVAGFPMGRVVETHNITDVREQDSKKEARDRFNREELKKQIRNLEDALEGLPKSERPAVVEKIKKLEAKL